MQNPPTHLGGFPEFGYYHSNLGKEDDHYKELDWILRNEGFQPSPFVNARKVPKRIIQRYATYRHLPSWEKSTEMRIFTLKGRELSLEDAAELNQPCIVEEKQYKLRMAIYTKDELRYLINLFKKYTSVFRLDSLGRRVPTHPRSHRFKKNIDNRERNRYIPGSWEVPLLTVTDYPKPKNCRDLLHASRFSVTLGEDSSTLIEILTKSKKQYLKEFLFFHSIHHRIDDIYVLRTFVEDYLEVA
ncbi:MAG: hypothetical protein AABX70_00025 [Nanoarchaeota archaeon]